jgi:hypothetical protein|uniref:Uncharacterized protein n=1 Tax=Myoviridae sp. ctLjW1 TaxID=2825084 RepID=A0A8S5PQF0_9CAUD|nr:MAG TPA: hypothetical protein [Myoviridae sp. ctLjW1]
MKYRNLCLINAVFDAHCDTCSVLKNSSFVTIPTEDEFLYCLEAILQTNLHSGKDTAALVKQEHFPVVTYRWMPACFTISAILIYQERYWDTVHRMSSSKKNWILFMRLEGFYKKCATSYCNL